MPRTDLQIDELLAKWGEGDQEALRALIPLIYEELRRAARQQLRRTPPPHTLQTTALVHEAYPCDSLQCLVQPCIPASKLRRSRRGSARATLSGKSG